VDGVVVAVVDVVDVTLVRHGHVTAGLAVLVLVLGVRGVLRHHALVRMVAVHAVQVAVVRVVHVAPVRNGHVTTAFPVHVRVVGVRTVLGRDRHL
jgi:hypothetical protein